MYLPIMHALTSTVTHERIDQIAMKYHLVKEVGFIIPAATMVIYHPPPGKIVFYLYYFEVGLCILVSPFFTQIIKAYKVHTC